MLTLPLVLVLGHPLYKLLCFVLVGDVVLCSIIFLFLPQKPNERKKQTDRKGDKREPTITSTMFNLPTMSSVHVSSKYDLL